MDICDKQSIHHEEYQNKFKDIKSMLKEFTVKMLDCCDNMKEATLFLTNDLKLYKKSQKVLKYPRINIAIEKNDVDFVSHDFCQEELRGSWLMSPMTGKVMQWGTSNYGDIALYCASCLLLLPFHVILYPFRKGHKMFRYIRISSFYNISLQIVSPFLILHKWLLCSVSFISNSSKKLN